LKTNRAPLLLNDNRSFRAHIEELGPGDTVVGLLNIKPTEEVLFLDLVERGVRLFPSALSQQLSRSKCLQAMVFRRWMVPHTSIVRDRHDMTRLINFLGEKRIGKVVTKQNRLNCGLGINIWTCIEEAYNQTCFGSLSYPFVLQPYIDSETDVRVIIIGDYSEAYWRHNSNSFRNNLYFGGNSGEYALSKEQMELCQTVMARGKFPYAHIDLMVTPNGDFYLGEINLRGGIKGARISTQQYRMLIDDIDRAFLKSVADSESIIR
jgi:glutathione synthase/RimK-type ligase-like ATP-grasp enzyme